MKSPGVVACFAIDRHGILREYGGRVKKGAMMLAAVQTVTKADPVGRALRHKAYVAGTDKPPVIRSMLLL